MGAILGLRVRHVERRRDVKWSLGRARERGVCGRAVELPAPLRLVAAEAGLDVVEDVRRRLELEVLVEAGAGSALGGARPAWRPAAAGGERRKRRRR